MNLMALGGNRGHESTVNARHDQPLAEAAPARALLASASKAVRCSNPVGLRLFRMPTFGANLVQNLVRQLEVNRDLCLDLDGFTVQ